jgi:hypothetical protein
VALRPLGRAGTTAKDVGFLPVCLLRVEPFLAFFAEKDYGTFQPLSRFLARVFLRFSVGFNFFSKP